MKLRNLKFFLPLALVCLMTGCYEESNAPVIDDDIEIIKEAYENEEIEVLAPEVEATSRGGRSSGKYTFRTLNAALHCTGLTDAVKRSKGTLYAPSDQAFAKLGLDRTNICEALDTETLVNILTYHFNLEKIGIREKGCFTQFNGDIIQVKRPSFRNYQVNDTRAYLKFKTRKLTVYAIEDVLFPAEGNIVGTAVAADDFNVLVSAVLAADPSIAAALSDEDAVFTVFAPTDAAFGDLLAALGLNSLEEAVAAVGVEGLSTILLYHVVDGCAVSNTLIDGAVIPTLSGETITIDLDNLSIIDKSGAPSGLIPSLLDIRTSNGVIHAIDKVLLPQAIIDAL